jgi:uncharacterized small protein (DUF1192 family)
MVWGDMARLSEVSVGRSIWYRSSIVAREDRPMDADDLEPRNKPKALRNLDPMSIEELNGYIAELEAEIVRTREAIGRKQASRAGAEAFFKR